MHVQFYNQISMIRLLFIAINQTQLPNTHKSSNTTSSYDIAPSYAYDED